MSEGSVTAYGFCGRKWASGGQLVLPGTAQIQIREPLVTCFTADFCLVLIDPEICDRYVVPKRRQRTAALCPKTIQRPLHPGFQAAAISSRIPVFGVRNTVT
jgi:hypothetical protein